MFQYHQGESQMACQIQRELHKLRYKSMGEWGRHRQPRGMVGIFQGFLYSHLVKEEMRQTLVGRGGLCGGLLQNHDLGKD